MVMLMPNNDNPIKTFKFLLNKAVGKFDHTHTFCHIIALRFQRIMREQASASGARNGLHTARFRPSPQGRLEGFRLADLIVASSLPHLRSSTDGQGVFVQSAPGVRHEKTDHPFFLSVTLFKSLAFHRTAV
jgi:hypothetical protein